MPAKRCPSLITATTPTCRWAKALILRNYTLLWAISILFEFMELTFQHMLPNFNECWWDSWILDVAVCNFIGILTGMATVRWYGSQVRAPLNVVIPAGHATSCYSGKEGRAAGEEPAEVLVPCWGSPQRPTDWQHQFLPACSAKRQRPRGPAKRQGCRVLESWKLFCNIVRDVHPPVYAQFFTSPAAPSVPLQTYDWRGISKQPTYMKKAKRSIMQLLPYSLDNFQWKVGTGRAIAVAASLHLALWLPACSCQRIKPSVSLLLTMLACSSCCTRLHTAATVTQRFPCCSCLSWLMSSCWNSSTWWSVPIANTFSPKQQFATKPLGSCSMRM